MENKFQIENKWSFSPFEADMLCQFSAFLHSDRFHTRTDFEVVSVTVGRVGKPLKQDSQNGTHQISNDVKEIHDQHHQTQILTALL